LTTQRAIELFAAVNFLIIGLSHIVQRGVWEEFFALLHSRGRAGALVNGFLSLFAGSLIVAFHNVWSGPAALLTLLGWAMVIKSAVIFLSPQLGLRSMELASPGKSHRIAASGVMLVAIGLALVYGIWRTTES
jgi:hypothetical protein